MSKPIAKVTDTIKKYWKEITVVAKNFGHLVEAVSLAVVSGYAIWASQYNDFSMQHADKVVLFAGVLIAVRAFWELIKTLNKR